MARSVTDTRVDRYALEQESRYRSDTIRTHDYMEGVSGDHVAAPTAMNAPQHQQEGDPRHEDGSAPGGARATYDSHAAFFGHSAQPEQAARGAASVSAASPYDGLEALAGLTFDPPSHRDHDSNPGAPAASEDPFASAAERSHHDHVSTQAPPGMPSLNPFAPSNPYASLTAASASSPATTRRSTYDPEPEAILEGHEASHTTPIRPVASPVDEHGVRERSTTDSSIKSSFIPEAPSAKALGKLRRVSVGQSQSHVPLPVVWRGAAPFLGRVHDTLFYLFG